MRNGIMDLLKKATTHDYSSSKGFTVDDLDKAAAELSSQPVQKPEYIMSKWEAENLPLWLIKWTSENYKLMCSTEVSNIIKKRQKNNQ